MRLDPINKNLALVIVDMQKKFVLKHDDKERQHDMPVAAMNTLAKMFRSAGRPVILVRFIGGDDHTGYVGDDGDDFIPELEVEETDIIVDKHHMNCFRETDLASSVKNRGCDGILLAGTVTQYCVISTYYGAFDHDLIPYLSIEACISTKDSFNAAASELCKDLSIEDVRRYLDGLPLSDRPPTVCHRGDHDGAHRRCERPRGEVRRLHRGERSHIRHQARGDLRISRT